MKTKNILVGIFNILVAFVSLIIIFQGFNSFKNPEFSNMFYRPEYYINYVAGFVRRGLDGQMIFELTRITGINPWKIQKSYTMLTIGIFIFLTLYVMIKKRIPFYTIFSMSCVLLLIYFSQGGIRKDHIILSLYLILLLILSKCKPKKNYFLTILFFNLIFCISILIHEIAFIFSFIPLLAFLIIKFNLTLNKRGFVILLKFFGLSTITFILCCFNAGSPFQEEIIKRSWDIFGLDKIEFYSGVFSRHHYIWYFVKKWDYLLLFLLFLAHFTFHGIAISNSLKNHLKANLFLVILSIQFLLALALSIIASDVSRWIVYSSFTATFMIFLIDESSSRLPVFSFDITSFSRKIYFLPYIAYFFLTSSFSVEDGIRRYYQYIPMKLIINFVQSKIQHR